MSTVWKKILIRNMLFTYARDSLIFFMNLYIWSQGRDLRQVAVFNILYLGFHLSAFPLFLPLIKRQKAQLLMRTGAAGIGGVLIAIALLKDNSPDYIYLLASATGIFNGMYWMVNHMFNFDQTNNENRTSFYAFMNTSTGLARLAVPAMGWLAFTIFGEGQAGYNAIFAAAALATLVAVPIIIIPQYKESDHKLLDSFRHLLKTPKLKLMFFGGFFWGLSLRSALAAVLLPFLIFQIVERESSLSLVQTAIEIVALGAVYLFGRYKKNTDHVSKLFMICLGTTLIGITALLINLSATTYAIYTLLYIVALVSGNISAAAMSNNFATTIPKYREYRAEFLVLREIAVLPGFMLGYVFVYFAPNLEVGSLTPLLIAMMLASIIAQTISLHIWRWLGRRGYHE